jgi:hypothetical protein
MLLRELTHALVGYDRMSQLLTNWLTSVGITFSCFDSYEQLFVMVIKFIS